MSYIWNYGVVGLGRHHFFLVTGTLESFLFFISRRRHKVLIFIKSLVKLLLTHSKLSGILLFALSVVDFSKIIFFHHFCHDTSFYQQNIFFFHLKIFKKFHGVKFFTISKKVKYNAPFFF